MSLQHVLFDGNNALLSGRSTNIIVAQLKGSQTCQVAGLVVRSASPVLQICRQLVAAGHHPDQQLHAYRGEVLCLRVRSIGAAAGLEVVEDGKGPRFLRRQSAGSRRPASGRRAADPGPNTFHDDPIGF